MPEMARPPALPDDEVPRSLDRRHGAVKLHSRPLGGYDQDDNPFLRPSILIMVALLVGYTAFLTYYTFFA